MTTEIILLRLLASTLVPILLSGLFTLLEKKTKFSNLNYVPKQLTIGIIFGLSAILATEYGVPTGDGVIMNVRDSSPLCAGLIFGAPAGLISGFIGGLYRWLCVYWGGGSLTRVACSLATLLAGIFSGLMRRRLFEDSKPGFLSAFGIGTTMEVLHMLLILATNLGNVTYAFSFVQVCAFPMILCNGVGVCCAVLISNYPGRREKLDIKNKRISYDFGFWLLVCVVIAFIATSGFTQQIIYRIADENAVLYRNVTMYLVVFMEILIYTALFILVYQMLKKKVVKNIQRINEGLNDITNGNLDTVINVRTYKEFSELSDDVNATVTTLKHYIKDAEERINKELEFAHLIQHSSLPSVFPPYPDRLDFEIYAAMDAAKEVGGDFYDFYMLNPFTIVFLIADVSGKGIPAAMFMMTAKTLIKGLAESGKSLGDVFTAANQKLCETNETGMFITAWLGKLDLRTGKLEFVNAGHNPPLLLQPDKKFEYLRTKPNFVLAGLDETHYKINEILLTPGDKLFLYTDGVTEAADLESNLYGESRLKELLDSVSEKSPKEICGIVKTDVSAFAGTAPQSDDITMLCLSFNAKQDKDTVETRPNRDSLKIIQTFLDSRLKDSNISEKILRRVQVATDEIWSNIVNYSQATTASLQLRWTNNILFLDFKDDGMPFDPTQSESPDTTLPLEVREIGGLGIHMVKKLCTVMEYSHSDNFNMLSLGFSE